MANEFDKFDESAAGANPFDQFDVKPAAKTKPAADEYAMPEYAPPAAKQPMTWGEAAGKAITNIPGSVGKLVGDIAQTVAHPIESARGLLDIGAGALQAVVPESVRQAVEKIDPNVEAAKEARKKAGAAGEFFKSRYGSQEGFKKAIAEDPAGVAADMASVLYGGGAALRAAKLPGAAAAAQKAASVIDPLANVARAGKKVLSGVKGTSAFGLGLTSGAGTDAIKEAYRAGKTGGETAKQFQEHLRGQAEFTDVLPIVKSDLQQLNKQKMAEYKANMAAVKADKTVLDFRNIDRSLEEARNLVTYRGTSGAGPRKVINPAAAETLQKIEDAVIDWQNLDADFHTPEGLDKLKQVVGGIVDGIPDKERVAQKVGTQIYNSIKSEIVRQAPIYSQTMKAYTDASEKVNEIERALSLGKRASADTALRKLQSIMRNNVATNYGNRLKLAKELQEKGGAEFMPALAGQTLSSALPRGLQRATTIPTTGGAFALGGGLAAIPALAASSPRLVGEAAYYAGKAAKGAKIPAREINKLATKFNTTPAEVGNILYQLRSRMEEPSESDKNQPAPIPMSEGMMQ